MPLADICISTSLKRDYSHVQLTTEFTSLSSNNLQPLVFMNPHREEYNSRVLYINRNADVFKDIVKHMQGYYVAARDEVHLENLVMDAHFFKLKRLVENLRQTM